VLEHGPTDIEREAAVCREQRGDLADCVARGCPLAAVAVGDSTAAPAARTSPTSDGAARHAASAPRPSPRGGGPAERDRADRRPAESEPVARSPLEQKTIDRRVESYRHRVATIESRFGAEERVPPSVSVFRESAK
jgi:hypothetical protein